MFVDEEFRTFFQQNFQSVKNLIIGPKIDNLVKDEKNDPKIEKLASSLKN